MYEAFYGLREKPFNLTPDPKYLYLSEKHREAFEHLRFGIKNRSGFAMVTGEIGTGKTTICRNLLNRIDTETELAFVFNPSLSPVELLKKINEEFGIDASPDNALELVGILNEYLLEAAAEGKNCVLVIDEAQNLSPQVLEQIRLLSNLETETEKLLQIILLGQPELLEKLALKELRQLNQRITTRYHLKALSVKETLAYIAYRLHVAGARNKIRFTRRAIKAVYSHSKGTPRVINAICDRALLIGYTKETHTISPGIVHRAAREVQGERVKARARPKQRSAWRRLLPSPALILIAVALIALLRFYMGPIEEAARQLSVFNNWFTALASVPDDTAAPGAPLTPDAAPESAAIQQILDRLRASDETRNGARGVPAEELLRELEELDAAEARAAAASAILRALGHGHAGRGPGNGRRRGDGAFSDEQRLCLRTADPRH